MQRYQCFANSCGPRAMFIPAKMTFLLYGQLQLFFEYFFMYLCIMSNCHLKFYYAVPFLFKGINHESFHPSWSLAVKMKSSLIKKKSMTHGECVHQALRVLMQNPVWMWKLKQFCKNLQLCVFCCSYLLKNTYLKQQFLCEWWYLTKLRLSFLCSLGWSLLEIS